MLSATSVHPESCSGKGSTSSEKILYFSSILPQLWNIDTWTAAIIRSKTVILKGWASMSSQAGRSGDVMSLLCLTWDVHELLYRAKNF